MAVALLLFLLVAPAVCSIPADVIETTFGYRLSTCTDATAGGWCGYVPLPPDAMVDVPSSTQDDSFRDLTAFSAMPIPFFHEPLLGGQPLLTFSGVSNGFLTPAGAGFDQYYDGLAYAGPVVHWPMIALFNADLYPPGSDNNMSSVMYSYIDADSQNGPSLLWNFDNVPLYSYTAGTANLTAQAQIFSNGTIIFRYRSVPPYNNAMSSGGIVGLVLSVATQFALDTPQQISGSNGGVYPNLDIYGYRLERISQFGGCPSATLGCASCIAVNCVYCGDSLSNGLCVPPQRAGDLCMPGKTLTRGCLRSPRSLGPYNATLLGVGSIPPYVSPSNADRFISSLNATTIQLPSPFPMESPNNASIAAFASILVWNASIVVSGAGTVIAPLSLPVSGGGSLLRPQQTSVSTVTHDGASGFCVAQSPCLTTLAGFWNVSLINSQNGALFSVAVELGPSGMIALYYLSSSTMFDGDLADTFTTVPQFTAGLDFLQVPTTPLLPGRSIVMVPNLPVAISCPRCYHGGVCNGDRSGCVCPLPFAGPRCELTCTTAPYNCSACNSSTSYCTCTGCLCRSGFSGLDCSAVAVHDTIDSRAVIAVLLIIVVVSMPLLCFLLERVKNGTPDESPEKSLAKALPPPKPIVPLEDVQLHSVLFPRDPPDEVAGTTKETARRFGRLHFSDEEYDML